MYLEKGKLGMFKISRISVSNKISKTANTKFFD